MESLAAAHGKIAVESPYVSGIFHSRRRTERLRDRIKAVLHSPGADELTQRRHAQVLSKAPLVARIGRSAEVFADDRLQQEIARSIAGDQRIPPPRPANGEF